MLRGARGAAAALDLEQVRSPGSMRLAPEKPQPFGTPSGKLEFHSETLAAQSLPLVPGWRPDGETVAGTINMLCTDRYTDIGEGASYQSTGLDITAWQEPIGGDPR